MRTPALAIQKGWHKIGRFDMAHEMKALIEACPVASFATIEVEKIYLVKNGYHQNGAVLTVVAVTAARKQATVTRWGEDTSLKLNAGDFKGAVFVELDEDLISLLGISHEMVVRSAIDQGLAEQIPGPVRCDYPDLFIDIPEQFGIRHETAVERVKRLVGRTSNWGMSVLNAARIEQMIESAHEMLSTYYAYSIEAQIQNPGIVGDMERSIQEEEKTVCFLRWLIPHISPGGALYVDGSELEEPKVAQIHYPQKKEIVPPFMMEVIK